MNFPSMGKPPKECPWNVKICDRYCVDCDIEFNKYAEEVKRGLNK